MSRFRPIDRDTDYLLPPSVQDWLPESHLARYVVDVVEGLDLSELERAYAGRGTDAYHPALLLSLLIYGYATGTYSSRKIERATYDSLAFRFIACDQHPDHDTLASFRRRFGKEFDAIFVQVLQVARENQLSRFGTVSLDGTKIHANASRHSALSHGHAEKIEAQLKAEVQEMLELAEAADQQALPDGVSLPEEIKRREDRLAAIAAAKAKIEARAKERHEREQAAYQAKLAKRQAREAKSGKKAGGKPPQPPAAGPRPHDQVNLTDEDSRIMKVAGGGFEQCYNAQGAVDTESMLVIATEVTQAANDKEQVEPMVGQDPGAARRAEPAQAALLADSGFFSERNVEACRRSPDRAADRGGARRTPSALAQPLRGARAAVRRGEPRRADEARAQDESGPRRLRASQADGGTGVWHHQVGDGLPPVPATRAGQRAPRMDAGLPRVELEAHGRIACAVEK